MQKIFLKKLVSTIFSLGKLVIRNQFAIATNLQVILSKSDSPKLLRILGNGDSLSELNDDIRVNHLCDYLVVNRFVLSDLYKVNQPRFYVLHDKHFSISEEGLSICQKINEDTSWDMFMLFPRMFTNHVNISKVFNNPKINIVIYNNNVFSGFDFIKYFLYKRNIAMPHSQNVLGASIYLGIYLNYETVELYGVEHSWTRNLRVNNCNEVCLHNPHFFDTKKPEIKTWKQIQGAEVKFHEALRLYALMFESYHNLAHFAKVNGVKILNCTPDSFIDAFERKNSVC